MPVHMRYSSAKKKWEVVDDKGDVKISYTKRADARRYVTARNIGEGHVPGIKPRKR